MTSIIKSNKSYAFPLMCTKVRIGLIQSD